MNPPSMLQPKPRAAAMKAQAAITQGLGPGGPGGVVPPQPSAPLIVLTPTLRSSAATEAAFSLDALSKAAETHGTPAANEKPSKEKTPRIEKDDDEEERPKRQRKAKEKDKDFEGEKNAEKDKDGEKEEKEKPQKRKKMFAKELRPMMYGFGDVQNPLPESVAVMEELVLEYVQEMTTKAMQVASRRGKLQTEDLVFLIRKDRKKRARVKQLLIMYDELKQARKAFDDGE